MISRSSGHLGSVWDSTVVKVAVTNPTSVISPRTLASASCPGLYCQRVTGVPGLSKWESSGLLRMKVAPVSVGRSMKPSGMM